MKYKFKSLKWFYINIVSQDNQTFTSQTQNNNFDLHLIEIFTILRPQLWLKQRGICVNISAIFSV